MSHPHDALLQAHLDGELEPSEMREVTRHLSSCESCREASAELATMSYRFSTIIGRLDDAEPAEWRSSASRPRSIVVAPAVASSVATLDADVRRRTRARPPRVLRGAESGRELPRLVRERPVRARSLSAWRWAAVALLTVTSVAAAAVVRGPLFHGSRPAPVASAPASTGAPPVPLRPAGAIAIAPARSTMDVVLDGAAAGSRLRVTVGSGAELAVSVRSDSASAEPARFRTGDARIAVQLPGATSLVDVQVPATARSARVLMGNAVVATVKDGRVTPAAAVEGIDLGSRR